MDIWREILSPDFLLRNSVYLSLLTGFICPLVGVFLILRRSLFLGVALPQISSTGVAFALSMHIWFGHETVSHDPASEGLAFLGSMTFSLLAIVWFAYREKNGAGHSESRLSTAYVLSIATSILLLAKCPQAEQSWMNLLKGQIIAISDSELGLTFVTFLVVLVCLLLFQKEFWLVSYDRELAITLRKNILLWDMFLYLLIGATIAAAVLSTGPLITFGYILIPGLVSRLFARNMRQLAVISSLVGGASALGGFWLAYRFDLPVGPTDVALLAALYATAFLAKKFCRMLDKLHVKESSRPASDPSEAISK